MSDFRTASKLEAIEDGVFAADIPEGWQQGAGAFGGLVVGILTRALLTTEASDPSRTLRSLSAELCGPALVGPGKVHVRVLRRGGSMTFVDSELRQERRGRTSIVARASAVLAVARDVPPVAISAAPPEGLSRWSDVPVIPIGPPKGPIFASHYEFRHTGPLPFTKSAKPACAGFIRERADEAHVDLPLDPPAIAALLDVFYPTLFPIEGGPRAIATVGYTMQLLCDPSKLTSREPVYFRAAGVAARENFLVEMRELWHEGTLLGLNQQTFAVLT